MSMSFSTSLAVSRLSTWSLAALALGALAAGCASVTEYHPREGLVSEMGADKAKTQLKELVLRAKQTEGGLVTSVEVSDEALKVRAQQSSLGMFYQMETRQLENDIYFPLVERVDIYDNHWAFVYASGRLNLKILFADEKDAQSFADLVMSFKAAKKT